MLFCITRLPFLYYLISKKVLKTLLFVIYTCFFVKFCMFLQRQKQNFQPLKISFYLRLYLNKRSLRNEKQD